LVTVYLNILNKILVSGADGIIFILDLYLCLFVLLDLCFYFFRGWFYCLWGVYFIMSDLVYCIDWTVDLLWLSCLIGCLLFIGFVYYSFFGYSL
jgi:hypothetical protein